MLNDANSFPNGEHWIKTDSDCKLKTKQTIRIYIYMLIVVLTYVFNHCRSSTGALKTEAVIQSVCLVHKSLSQLNTLLFFYFFFSFPERFSYGYDMRKIMTS